MKTSRSEAEVIDLGVYRRTPTGGTFAPAPIPTVAVVVPLVPVYGSHAAHPDYAMGFNDAQQGVALQGGSTPYRAGHKAFWVARGILQHASPAAEAFYSTNPVNVRAPAERPREELTAEGVQLVIPGTERRMPAGRKQLELF